MRAPYTKGDKTGTITLEAFPPEGASLTGRRVAGRFEFSTQNRSGSETSVKGSFDFEG